MFDDRTDEWPSDILYTADNARKFRRKNLLTLPIWIIPCIVTRIKRKIALRSSKELDI